MAGGRSGQAGSGGSHAPSIDEVVLRRLVTDLGADNVAEVCGVFIADARTGLGAARAGCESGDARTVARSAHRVKSASGFVGAGGVSSLCGEIERLALEDRLDDAAARVGIASDELERAYGALRALVPGLPRLDERTGGP